MRPKYSQEGAEVDQGRLLVLCPEFKIHRVAQAHEYGENVDGERLYPVEQRQFVQMVVSQYTPLQLNVFVHQCVRVRVVLDNVLEHPHFWMPPWQQHAGPHAVDPLVVRYRVVRAFMLNEATHEKTKQPEQGAVRVLPVDRRRTVPLRPAEEVATQAHGKVQPTPPRRLQVFAVVASLDQVFLQAYDTIVRLRVFVGVYLAVRLLKGLQLLPSDLPDVKAFVLRLLRQRGPPMVAVVQVCNVRVFGQFDDLLPSWVVCIEST